MATNLITIPTIGICASASGNGNRSSATTRRSTLSPSSSSSSSWWSPLFGWSSDPDYIDVNSKQEQIESKPARSKFAPGKLTEEKAKQLRMMTTGTETFHDVMYHSAIASRLASDFSGSSDL